ncbi:MAG: hypothetical protein H9897_02275 [Candidatus Ureaplasma intestinipullorum]|uniref:Uncharacterized protein n=1 Tax=Candidatus Ureaplasma intestinipullorum TaxID=2838770 RepID=A0A9E2NW56_9BACT|nr:hypothetical protein [Candidatus Ureaplasma intestinipullorum]
MDQKKFIKDAKNLFRTYKNYKFKIDNIELIKRDEMIKNIINTDDSSLNLKIQKMSKFLNLMDLILDELNEEERNILKSTYIDNIHYSKTPYSQSSYFVKRKNALKHLYDLLLNFEIIDF